MLSAHLATTAPIPEMQSEAKSVLNYEEMQYLSLVQEIIQKGEIRGKQRELKRVGTHKPPNDMMLQVCIRVLTQDRLQVCIRVLTQDDRR